MTYSTKPAMLAARHAGMTFGNRRERAFAKALGIKETDGRATANHDFPPAETLD